MTEGLDSGKRWAMHFSFDSLWASCLAIWLTSFLHEDGGIILGGYLVLQHDLPFYVAGLALFAGLVTGDVVLYGFGAGARTIPWMRQFLLRNPVEKARQWLTRNQTVTVVVCRLTPGLMFATYAACGFFRLSFRRFFVVTGLTAALYTPLMLWLAVALGQSVIQKVGLIGWLVLLIAGFVVAAKIAYRAGNGFLEKMGVQGAGGVPEARREIAGPELEADSPGTLQRRVGPAECIPPPLFYLPVGLHWIGLGLRHRSITLPSAANPSIEGGGLWGESKSHCLDLIQREQRDWVAPYALLRRSGGAEALEADMELALARLRDGGLDFPLVGKPDVGWQGYGVQVLSGAEALRSYVAKYPAGTAIVLQQPVPWEGEAGVFYVRRPGQERGWISSLTFRYHPTVTGDGRRSLHQLILDDPRLRFKRGAMLGNGRWHCSAGIREPERVPVEGERVKLAYIGSIRVGGLYRDACHLITPELTERIDAVARSMKEFHYGRFDIRFRSVEALQRGEDFRIFEINGAGAEIIHIWDPEKSLGEVFRVLMEGQRLLFEIGAANRARGFKPVTWREFTELARRQNRLIEGYPPSE